MSLGLAAAAVFLCVNPPRVRLSVPEHARVEVFSVAALVVLAAAAGGLALADPFLDALDVSGESFRIATGLVLALRGLERIVRPRPGEVPVLPGRLAALVPVAFPVLVTPELALLVVSAGADERGVGALIALAGALAVTAALTALPRGGIAEGVLVGLARLLAALLVAVGVGLVVDSVRDV